MGKVTIRDVARRAGVSVSTCSVTFNHPDSREVGAETKERVRRVARELGFVPSVIGRVINRKKWGGVAAVLPISSTPLFLHIVGGVDRVVEYHTRQLFVSYTQDRPAIEAKVLRTYLDLNVDGLLLAPVPGRSNLALFRQAAAAFPVVQVERRALREIDFVGADHAGAAHAVTRALLDKGYEAVGIVLYKRSVSVDRERLRGYRKAMREAGRGPKKSWIRRLDLDYAESTVSFAERFRAVLEADGPRAWLWAAGPVPLLLERLGELGWTNGRDVDIVLFDGLLPPGDFVTASQAFVNIRQPADAMGVAAMQHLVERERPRPPEEPPLDIRLPCAVERLVVQRPAAEPALEELLPGLALPAGPAKNNAPPPETGDGDERRDETRIIVRKGPPPPAAPSREDHG